MSASRRTTLALLHTRQNTVPGKLLRISVFKTTGALPSLNDISRQGPDRPSRISVFGKFPLLHNEGGDLSYWTSSESAMLLVSALSRLE